MSEKGEFLRLLHDLCASIPNPQYKFGRPRMPLSDMVFSSALKVYSTFSLRRFTTDMREAKEKGYIEKVPYYSTVARYMENPELTPILIELIQKSSLPLSGVETEFAADASGFSTSRFDRWFSFKHGREISSRIWLKAHLMCGVKTNIVTAIKITEGHESDGRQFPELLDATAENFKIEEISADKAYSSRKNHTLVWNLGGKAYIPFKSNATGKTPGSKAWRRMYHLFQYHRDEFLEHYHKRSNSETVFHMVKAKFGDAVRSKKRTAQINEVLLKILCHNLCVLIHELYELNHKNSY